MKRHSGKTTDNINIMYPENPRSRVVTDNNKEHSLGSRLSCSRLVSAAMCVQCKAGTSPSGRPRRFPAEISRVRTLCEFKIIREGNLLSRISRIIAKKTTRLELFHSFKDQNKFPITQSILKYNLLRFLSPLPEHIRTFWPAAIKVDSWTL